MADFLNVAGVILGSHVNGPGRRAAVWVQGCTIRCPCCCNPELQPHEARHLVDPVRFAEALIEAINENGLDGLTISGGEPFQQASALSELTRNVKKAGISIVCFTGYRKDDILYSRNASVRNLLNDIDLLIAGPYLDKIKGIRSWCDCPDKDLILLTSRYSREDFTFGDNEEAVLSEGSYQISGFMGQYEKRQLQRILG